MSRAAAAVAFAIIISPTVVFHYHCFGSPTQSRGGKWVFQRLNIFRAHMWRRFSTFPFPFCTNESLLSEGREKNRTAKEVKEARKERKKLIKTQHIFAIFLYSCKLNNNDSLRNDLKVNWLWGRVEMRQAENDGLLTAANCYLLTCSEHCVRPTMTAIGGVKLGEE